MSVEPMIGSQPALVAGERLVLGDYVKLERLTGRLVRWRFSGGVFGCIRRAVPDGGEVYPLDFGLETWADLSGVA